MKQIQTSKRTKSTVACGRSVRAGWWLGAVRLVAAAPLRLHHYRDVHTRMVRDALCATDCARESHDSVEQAGE